MKFNETFMPRCADWKRVEENLHRLFENPEDVEDLKKRVLQNAVMGKRVPQNTDDEPASELLKKIAKEKAALIQKGEINKQNPLPKIREDEKPFEIPEGWCGIGWEHRAQVSWGGRTA